MRSLIPLSLLLILLDTCVHAVVFPVQIIPPNSPTHLNRRASIPIYNNGNAQYIANVTVGGVQLPVLLDTGSSDLWVNFPSTASPQNLKDTGKAITLSYAVGQASGDIYTTEVSFGNVTVENQAFLNVANASTFNTDIASQGYYGLLGLGPNSGSVIKKKLSGSTGYNLLQNVFGQDKTTSNSISFLLDRKGDPTESFTGQFAIAEIIPGFENVTTMPKLDVETVSKLLQSDQHWQALTDKNMGIIGPDGEPIQIKSIVPKAPSGQYVAVFDSGFTFSQVPRKISDAIYGRVKGAVYDSTNQYWTVPCGQYLNISFQFGGQTYPIHPLDVVDNNFSIEDASGNHVCIGAFQPITSAFSILGHYDMILGMSFLRNTYTLMDFGSWVANTNDTGHPYIQLASVTEYDTARADFVKVRLSGIDSIDSSQWALLPANETQASPVSAEEKKKMYQEMILSRWPYIFVGCLVFITIVIGLCIWRCCCRRGKKPAHKKNKKSIFSGKVESSAYLPLEIPARQQDASHLSYGSSQQYLPYQNTHDHGGQGYNSHQV